jgi:transcriptional regulator
MGQKSPAKRRQLDAFQPEVTVADPAEAHAKKLTAICGIRIAIDEVRGKFKYGGNVDEAHRKAVAERLDDRGGPGDAAAATHVHRRVAEDT